LKNAIIAEFATETRRFFATIAALSGGACVTSIDLLGIVVAGAGAREVGRGAIRRQGNIYRGVARAVRGVVK